MPLIEELPLSTPSRAQPGWAYVPEASTQAAAAAAAGQITSRKRNRGLDTLGSQSAKQQKAIEQRLKDLEKENYKDVQIAIPKREGGDGAGGGGRATATVTAGAAGKSQREGKKTSSNVRRILGYNRTFAHYLADEEAAIQAGQQPYYMQGINLPVVAAAAANQGKDKDAKRRDGVPAPSSSSRASAAQQQQQQQQQQQRQKTPARVKTEQSQDVDMTGLSVSPATPKSPRKQAAQDGSSSSPTMQAPPAAPTATAYPAQWDNDPLLRTLGLPARPSERVMQQLVAEPALSWNEARAKQTGPAPPSRHFCIMCGYWGKVKCRKCAERVCGAMECWRAHEAGGCGDQPY